MALHASKEKKLECPCKYASARLTSLFVSSNRHCHACVGQAINNPRWKTGSSSGSFHEDKWLVGFTCDSMHVTLLELTLITRAQLGSLPRFEQREVLISPKGLHYSYFLFIKMPAKETTEMTGLCCIGYTGFGALAKMYSRTIR